MPDSKANPINNGNSHDSESETPAAFLGMLSAVMISASFVTATSKKFVTGKTSRFFSRETMSSARPMCSSKATS